MPVEFVVRDGKVYKTTDGKTYTEHIPMGVNVRASGYGSALWQPDRDISSMVKTWGYNTARLSLISDSYSGAQGHNDKFEWTGGATNLRDLKELVKRFLDAGMEAVQLCPRLNGSNGAGVDLSPGNAAVKKLKAFWKHWANVYKNDQRVWFNIVNEPKAGGTALRDAYKEIIKEIRDTGAKNVIVLDSMNWGQDQSSPGEPTFPTKSSWICNYAQDIVKSYDNVVFALHFYGSGWRPTNDGKKSVEELRSMTKKKVLEGLNAYLALDNPKVSFHVGEYNVNDMENTGAEKSGDDFNQEKEAAMTAGIVDACIEKQIGTIPWSWSNLGGDDSGPINSGSGGDIKLDKDKPTNLNRLGKIMWADVKRPQPKLHTFTSPGGEIPITPEVKSTSIPIAPVTLDSLITRVLDLEQRVANLESKAK